MAAHRICSICLLVGARLVPMGILSTRLLVSAQGPPVALPHAAHAWRSEGECCPLQLCADLAAVQIDLAAAIAQMDSSRTALQSDTPFDFDRFRPAPPRPALSESRLLTVGARPIRSLASVPKFLAGTPRPFVSWALSPLCQPKQSGSTSQWLERHRKIGLGQASISGGV